MSDYNIRLQDALSDSLEKRMRQDLIKYEADSGIDINYKKYFLVLELPSGEVVGVLHAYTAFAEIHIEDMWVDSSYQRQGYGTALIQALENMFQGKGFNNINLVTSAFQAPDFYKKCGFRLEFVRKNEKNPKLTKYFFIKYFDDEMQTQGLLDKN